MKQNGPPFPNSCRQITIRKLPAGRSNKRDACYRSITSFHTPKHISFGFNRIKMNKTVEQEFLLIWSRKQLVTTCLFYWSHADSLWLEFHEFHIYISITVLSYSKNTRKLLSACWQWQAANAIKIKVVACFYLHQLITPSQGMLFCFFVKWNFFRLWSECVECF